jgi:septal ring-binding cell division protein DamX
LVFGLMRGAAGTLYSYAHVRPRFADEVQHREQPMNNFSPLRMSDSDARLSRPEAAAPIAVNPALQTRQRKLRRVVAWVVGGAALLMCAGLVRAAVRSHSDESLASESANPTAQSPTPAAAPIATAPAAVAAVTAATADPAATQPVAASPASNANPAPAQKVSVTASHPTRKLTKRQISAKSAALRH